MSEPKKLPTLYAVIEETSSGRIVFWQAFPGKFDAEEYLVNPGPGTRDGAVHEYIPRAALDALESRLDEVVRQRTAASDRAESAEVDAAEARTLLAAATTRAEAAEREAQRLRQVIAEQHDRLLDLSLDERAPYQLREIRDVLFAECNPAPRDDAEESADE